MLSQNFQRLNLTIACLSALFCLCPLPTLDAQTKNNAYDDGSFEQLNATLMQRSPSFLASLFVVLIPAADLLLDLICNIFAFLKSDNEVKKKKTETTVVVRLSDVERILFIIGIGIQSVVWFLPVSTDLPTLKVVYFSTTNAGFLLVGCPMLTFLQRCTTTFTTIRATSVVCMFCLGFLAFSVANLLNHNPRSQRLLNYSGWLIVGLAELLFISLILLCGINYCQSKIGTASSRTAIFSWIRSSFRRTEAGVKGGYDIDYDNELYANHIPAVYMTSIVMMIFSTIYVSAIGAEQNVTAFERRNYMIVIAEIMVLVSELRIRKNEHSRGLIALLNSKKSYVRHISHELRTPLNTAFLGLKLLSSALKKSKVQRDIEQYDTLCDVHMSCKAAVDILNDLLCYDKLESGILELHKEEITVMKYLEECVSMFSLQIRECGVTVNIVNASDTEVPMGEPNDDDKVRAQPLQPHDSLYADKFKMDQVIRNLISNALKFTPRGGAITIRATFVPDSDQFRSQSSQLKGLRVVSEGVTRDNTWTRSISNFLKPRNPGSVSNYDDTAKSPSPPSDRTYGNLVVVVTDSGAGISVENQSRLFNEIVQFNPEKLQAGGGSGLGLWITQEIIHLHNGQISVYSEGEGKGSSFTVSIPMQQWRCNNSLIHSTRNPLPPSPRVVPSLLSSFRMHEPASIRFGVELGLALGMGARSSVSIRPCESPYNGNDQNNDDDNNRDKDLSATDHAESVSAPVSLEVLVVDDSRLNRKMLMLCLRADGHVCVEAADGLEAIAMVKERIGYATGGQGKPFDTVLMDFIMPNMDGPTATREIRALGYTAPIFGVTGNGLPSDIEHFLSCGANRVLLKPLDVDAFSKAMREVEELSNLLKRLHTPH